MYPRYNMYQNGNYMYNNRDLFRTNRYNRQNDRFFGGGFLAPLLIGGIAGYAIGRPNYNCYGPRCFYQYPFVYPNYYYNNFYY